MAFEIRPLDGPFGAGVLRYQPGCPIAAAERERLVRTWAEQGLLCFRDLRLEPSDFLALARLFGTPSPQPLQRAEYRVEGFPELRVLSSRHVDTFGDGKPLLTGGTWHTDHSHLPDPPWGTLLHALRLPTRGGATCFANLTLAYAGLSVSQRAELDGLEAEHRYLSKFSRRRLQALTPAEERRRSCASHPLVRAHPVTGRPTLYFNPVRIETFSGMSEQASQALLDRLVRHCERPEYVYRHQWRGGDVLLWDNRQTLHRVEHDYPADELRLMHRTLIGSPELAESMRRLYQETAGG